MIIIKASCYIAGKNAVFGSEADEICSTIVYWLQHNDVVLDFSGISSASFAFLESFVNSLLLSVPVKKVNEHFQVRNLPETAEASMKRALNGWNSLCKI